MKQVMAAALLLAGMGSAMAQGAVERAQAALTACFTRTAAELDDGASDARTIATAAVSECHAERRALLQSAAQSSAVDIDRQMLSSREVSIDRATITVLRVRKERKAGR